MSDNYLDINKANWNQRTSVHVESEFYNLEGFYKGENKLNSIELDLLGDLSGKKVLHLQCHFGLDTLSMARMEEEIEVVGVDFSEVAIEKAMEIRDASGLKDKVRFVCSDVYQLSEVMKDEQHSFDVVFTSYGTIGWLPDLDKWAGIIAYFLKPGGRFVFAEFHPVVWMFDSNFSKVEYSYFNTEEIVDTNEGTYTDGDDSKTISETSTISWNHPMSEVLEALFGQRLMLQTLREFDYSPYDCFNGTEEFEPGKYRISHLDDKIPMVYALECVKGK